MSLQKIETTNLVSIQPFQQFCIIMQDHRYKKTEKDDDQHRNSNTNHHFHHPQLRQQHRL